MLLANSIHPVLIITQTNKSTLFYNLILASLCYHMLASKKAPSLPGADILLTS